jgi:phage shock protein A
MADTLKSRVARVIAGSVHAFLDRIEDAAPSAMLEQSVRELEQIAADVRGELGLLVANRHLAQQQHLHLNKEHEALSTSLATALSEGRDDLAKPAIARQIDIEAQLPILESSLSQLAQEEKELTGYADALMGKKREMEKAIADLAASRRASEIAPAKTSNTGARVDAAQAAFDRTYQRQTGLSEAGRGATLEQAAKLKELSELVRDNKINERLAALKAGQ